MLHNSKNHIIFASVFHRILDFKAGLDFYLGPFFYFSPAGHISYKILITPSLSASAFFSATR